jgi:hypothetical protein
MALGCWKFRLPVAVTAVACIAPWFVTTIAVSGLALGIVFLFALSVLLGLGYLTASAVVGDLASEERWLLAPGLGYVIACGTLALAVRLGLPAGIGFWVLTFAAAIAVIRFARRTRTAGHRPVEMGLLYVGLFTLVCLIYFLPGAVKDAVTLSDGRFTWIYVDTQYHHAVAASIKTSLGPPKMPGLGIADLEYHFGNYALSGALSAATGIPLSDAYARLVRGAAQLCLLTSAIALGRILSRQAGGLAGLAAVVGLFFFGSIGSLFSDYVNSSSPVSGAILFEIPNIFVKDDGGPFSHLILGHSVMNGMIGICALTAIILAKSRQPDGIHTGPDISVLLPALVATIHGVAGLGVLGIYMAVLLVTGRWRPRAWTASLLSLTAFLLALKAMGFLGSAAVGHMRLNPVFAETLLMFFVWVFVGLNVRLYALAWITKSRQTKAGLLVALYAIGYGLYSLVIYDQNDNHSIYGIKFLQCIFSLFAFAALGDHLDAWLRNENSPVRDFWRELPDFAFWTAIVFLVVACVAFGALMISGGLTPSERWSLKMTVFGALAVSALAWLARLLAAKPTNLSILPKFAIAVVIVLASSAWIAPWLNFGMGRMRMNIQLSKEETNALHILKDLSSPSDLFATNRHEPDALIALRASKLNSANIRGGRSYSYSTLLERRVLLEGWEYGEKLQPAFPEVRMDNDTLFDTRDAEEALRIVRKYGIRFIIDTPGTDLAYSHDARSWLVPVPEVAPIKAYKVLPSHV